TPKTWAITASDDDRCRRSELRFGGAIELRYRGREVILSRGDIVLLTAPLAGAPTDVFFEGRATVHGISLDRTKDSPASLPSNQIEAKIERPAELVWTPIKPEVAKPELQADGSVRFAAVSAKE